MSTGEYVTMGMAIFNILLGLIAFFGGMVIDVAGQRARRKR